MNYRHLEVFFAVMTTGTVTEAARQLGVSQPSVTTTLKQAESALGIMLFQREGGRLIPTEEANLLFEEAERAHDALTAFRSLAARLRVGQGGHVRIAAIPSISQELLPDAIERFERLQRGFAYSVSTFNTEEILAQLDSRKGTFQLGFSLGDHEASGLNSQHIGDADLFGVFPADWEMPAAGDVDLGELGDAPYIACFPATPLGQTCQRLFVDAGIQPRIVAKIHSHQLAGRLVQRRLGYAVLDAITVRALLHDRLSETLVVRRIIGQPTIPVTAMFPGNRSLGNPTQLFLECFQEAYDALSRTVEDRLPAP